MVGPAGEILPDLAGRLPGRGLWVRAEASALKAALAKGLFARAARRAVTLPEGLLDGIEAGLARRVLAALGLACKAGAVVTGFERVRERLAAGPVGLLLEALDGAADGRGKLLALARASQGKDPPPLLGCFTAAQLSLALGRENVVHAALEPGRASEHVLSEAGRLAGLRPLAPPSWGQP